VNLALPVNLFVADNLATSLNTCHVTLATRTILKEKESGGACLAYFVEYLLERVAAGEEKQKYGNVYS
jgi:hypothetical protein